MATEADTCRDYVVPMLEAAGWSADPHSIGEQVTFTDGRIIAAGGRPRRRPGKRADYMGWVKHSLAEDRQVTGVIVAKKVNDKIRYAASVIPNAVLFEYSMTFALHPADEVHS